MILKFTINVVFIKLRLYSYKDTFEWMQRLDRYVWYWKKSPKHCLKLGPWFCCNSNNGTSCFCVCSRIEDTISAMVLYTHVYKWIPQRSLYCIYIYRFVRIKFCPLNFCVHLSKYLRTVFNIRFYKVEQWSFCAITRGNFYRSENAFFSIT